MKNNCEENLVKDKVKNVSHPEDALKYLKNSVLSCYKNIVIEVTILMSICGCFCACLELNNIMGLKKT
ncbi:CLUMA_CG010525, isoform A [Clunio marinus]|uniref:CLUMA_CG010525, isoform A n=1 Tax=Clunio marinus TaxID=568069 RepID=A0A1J1IA46_9DIPT|nr:CLUMA_CG010525, isoform A [Clunio marinus]